MRRFVGIVYALCLAVVLLLPTKSYAQLDAASMQRGGLGVQSMGGGVPGMGGGIPGMGDH